MKASCRDHLPASLKYLIFGSNAHCTDIICKKLKILFGLSSQTGLYRPRIPVVCSVTDRHLFDRERYCRCPCVQSTQ
uniref:Uncharacterized protein n=1 Tax=Magnetospirillum gryphiswaldense TaxID=55518 RepID=A4U2C9_9PROT|nr:hypothetical protein MGR_3539 [Magnetospirillum gryphiswaldense MSR-1]